MGEYSCGLASRSSTRGGAIGKTGPSVMCDIPEPLKLSSWTVPRASDDRVVAVAQLSDW